MTCLMSCGCDDIFCGLGCIAGKTLDTVASKVKSCSAGCASIDEQWESFKLEFNKVYVDDADEAGSKQIFEQSLKQVTDGNARSSGAPVFALNWMADRKPEERYQRGYKRNSARRSADVEVLKVANPSHPRSIDWTLTEAVTPIKNQGQCGSCWAFSATETIESHFILGNGMTYGVSLSPQQITSCTTADYGCGGGEPMDAYDYVMSVPGLTNEWNWPYVQSMVESTATANCSAAKEQAINGTMATLEGVYAQLDGYKFATAPCYGAGCYEQNLTQLAEAVEHGPVSICVVAQEWDFYAGGVMSADACGPMGDAFVDHCVQLVGFEKNAPQPYWIVRNSWGTEWGEDGNIFLQFDLNSCGLADEATVPLIKGASEEFRASFLQRAIPSATVSV